MVDSGAVEVIGEEEGVIGAKPPVGSNYCTSHACKYNFVLPLCIYS
jgi:hypothetical protein